MNYTAKIHDITERLRASLTSEDSAGNSAGGNTTHGNTPPAAFYSNTASNVLSSHLTDAGHSERGQSPARCVEEISEPRLYAFQPSWQGTIASSLAAFDYIRTQAKKKVNDTTFYVFISVLAFCGMGIVGGILVALPLLIGGVE